MRPTALLLLPLLCACRVTFTPRDVPAGARAPERALRESERSEPERSAVERVLDGWHAAAARADGAAYFDAMDEGAIFLGTDAGERWTLAEFRAFCEPYFSQGKGWTYEPRARHVFLAGDLAWFDERLWNEKYGDCRGTGVLRRVDGRWRIAHYSLTLLVPNERAAAVVDVIRGG